MICQYIYCAISFTPLNAVILGQVKVLKLQIEILNNLDYLMIGGDFSNKNKIKKIGTTLINQVYFIKTKMYRHNIKIRINVE